MFEEAQQQKEDLPEMYREMSGVGVPIAMHRMVMLDPSTTRFTGFIVGGCNNIIFFFLSTNVKFVNSTILYKRF